MSQIAHEVMDDELSIPNLVVAIARSLVDKPDRVSVEASTEQEATVLRLRVDPDDVGKVIGKQGRTARSLRAILGAAGMKLKHRYSLDIVEVDPTLKLPPSSAKVVQINPDSRMANRETKR